MRKYTECFSMSTLSLSFKFNVWMYQCCCSSKSPGSLEGHGACGLITLPLLVQNETCDKNVWCVIKKKVKTEQGKDKNKSNFAARLWTERKIVVDSSSHGGRLHLASAPPQLDVVQINYCLDQNQKIDSTLLLTLSPRFFFSYLSQRRQRQTRFGGAFWLIHMGP